MTIEQELLRDTARRLFRASGEVAPKLWDGDIWDELAAGGMTGVGVAESCGGSGGGLADAATLVFEVGRHAISVPLAEHLLAGWLAEDVGWRIGSTPVTVALADPELRCEVRDGALLLAGTLEAVPWARMADRLLVVAAASEGTLLAWLPAGTGVEVHEATNLAGEPRDAVLIPPTVLAPSAWAAASRSLSEVLIRAALLRSAQIAGAMTSVLDLSVQHATDRSQFGRSLSQFQAVQQLLARLAGEVAITVTGVRTAIDAIDDSRATTVGSAAAIARSRRAATVASRIGHQVHGAIGITEEHRLHRFTNRLWSWRTEHGSEAFWSRQVADAVGADLWLALTAAGPQ